MAFKMLSWSCLLTVLFMNSCSTGDQESLIDTENEVVVKVNFPVVDYLIDISDTGVSLKLQSSSLEEGSKVTVELQQDGGAFEPYSNVSFSDLPFLFLSGLKANTFFKLRIKQSVNGVSSDFSPPLSFKTYSPTSPGEFLILDTSFKGGWTGTVTNPSKKLAFSFSSSNRCAEYGGLSDIMVSGSGRFRTEKIDGVWHMIDPHGHLFFGLGVNSVKAPESYSNVKIPQDLLDYNFNHMANWSEYEQINLKMQVPYFTRELFLQGYKNESDRGKDLFANGIIPVFDSEFETFSDNLGQEIADKYANDPYLIGLFSDNELPNYSNETYGRLLERFLGIGDKSDPNYLAAHNWMVSRKGENYQWNDVDDQLWHGVVAERYFSVVYAAIKKYAPDILYAGSRFHGDAKNRAEIFTASSPYIDIFSINFYGPSEPTSDQMMIWNTLSEKPFIISEFYAKSNDVDIDNSSGAGYKVPTQRDRALYFENITLNLLTQPNCIGYQWFKFQDDNSNRGLISVDESFYYELMLSISKIQRDIYSLRKYMINAN